MFFSKEQHIIEIVGVYRGKRKQFKRTASKRSHSSVGIRLNGSCTLDFDDKSIVIDDKTILYIPAMSQYCQTVAEDEIISVCFIEYGSCDNTISTLALDDNDEMKNDFIHLHNVWESKENGYQIKCTELFYNILYKAKQTAAFHNSDTNHIAQLLAPAISYIHANYTNEEIIISELAAKCFLSEAYFRRIFKSLYHLTPLEYIRLLRIDVAASLLSERVCSVSEAARQTGFSDVKYFSKIFKKIKGVSPSKYS